MSSEWTDERIEKIRQVVEFWHWEACGMPVEYKETLALLDEFKRLRDENARLSSDILASKS